MQKGLPSRKLPRLKGYDYSLNGAYFITICVEGKQKLLCNIIMGAGLSRSQTGPPPTQIELCEYGFVVDKWINKIPEKYACVKIDNYVIMPNHIHILLFINNNGRDNPAPTLNNGRDDTAPTIGKIMGYFKYQTTKEINIPGFWQRSYHDHIIRDEDDYQIKWKYINDNPARWENDKYFI